MSRLGGFLICMAVAAAILAISAERGSGIQRMTSAGGEIARVECQRPAGLRLRRFEDGSAQLLCGFRVLVRIGVPG